MYIQFYAQKCMNYVFSDHYSLTVRPNQRQPSNRSSLLSVTSFALTAISSTIFSNVGRNQSHLQWIVYVKYINFLFFIFDVSLVIFILF